MEVIDFIYDSEKLSDFGMVVCSFNGTNDSFSIGNTIAINKVKGSRSDKYMSTGYQYDSTFNFEMQIAKNPCTDDNVELNLTDKEITKIVRWLNRKKNCKFSPIYDDGSFSDVYYYGTFNIEVVSNGKHIVGLTLSFDSNAPYGFGKEKTIQSTLNSNNTLTITDDSDEIGYVYAYTTVRCLTAGNLTISNSLDPFNSVVVNNCKSGEIITLDGQLKLINSSTSHNKLCNDFNWRYLRIANTYNDTVNKFTSSISCEITITYAPIRKVGMIL